MSTPAPSQASSVSSASKTENTIDSRLNGIVANVVALVQNRSPPTTSNILNYAIEIMQNVERFTGLTGDQKLRVLQSAITIIIRDSNLSALEKEALQALVSTMLPEFSKIVCLASKGILDINKKIESACKSCWKKC